MKDNELLAQPLEPHPSTVSTKNRTEEESFDLTSHNGCLSHCVRDNFLINFYSKTGRPNLSSLGKKKATAAKDNKHTHTHKLRLE